MIFSFLFSLLKTYVYGVEVEYDQIEVMNDLKKNNRILIETKELWKEEVFEKSKVKINFSDKDEKLDDWDEWAAYQHYTAQFIIKYFLEKDQALSQEYREFLKKESKFFTPEGIVARKAAEYHNHVKKSLNKDLKKEEKTNAIKEAKKYIQMAHRLVAFHCNLLEDRTKAEKFIKWYFDGLFKGNEKESYAYLENFDYSALNKALKRDDDKIAMNSLFKKAVQNFAEKFIGKIEGKNQLLAYNSLVTAILQANNLNEAVASYIKTEPSQVQKEEIKLSGVSDID